MTKLALTDAITELRGQIEEAANDAKNEKLQFELGPIELELKIQLSGETTVEGGLKAWVVSLGATDKASETSTHTVKLTLTPKQDLRVGARIPHDPRAGQR
jgi:hypothetical protein